MTTDDLNLQTSYNRVAAEYAQQFHNEMATKPFDCKMLDWLAEKVEHQSRRGYIFAHKPL